MSNLQEENSFNNHPTHLDWNKKLIHVYNLPNLEYAWPVTWQMDHHVAY